MLPTAVTLPDVVMAKKFAPELVKIPTLFTPSTLTVTLPLAAGMITLLLPLAMPVTPPVAYNSVKFSLVFINAVRMGSPKPSLGEEPTLIIC
jgi:hypothetical protein